MTNQGNQIDDIWSSATTPGGACADIWRAEVDKALISKKSEVSSGHAKQDPQDKKSDKGSGSASKKSKPPVSIKMVRFDNTEERLSPNKFHESPPGSLKARSE